MPLTEIWKVGCKRFRYTRNTNLLPPNPRRMSFGQLPFFSFGMSQSQSFLFRFYDGSWRWIDGQILPFPTQVIVQVFVSFVVVGEVADASGELPFQSSVCVSSCLVIVEQAVNAPVPVQHIYGFGNIGNGIEDDIILPVKVGHGRAVLHP